MINAIKNSFIGKLFSTLFSWYPHSLCGRSSAFLKAQYQTSKTKRLVRRFCITENRSIYSVYGRTMTLLANKLRFFGPMLQNSLFVRTLYRIGAFLKKAVSQSFLLRPLRNLTMRRFIILCLVATIPVDYFCRNVVPSLTIVASAWDEMLILGAFLYLLYDCAISQHKVLAKTTPVDAYLLLFMAVGFVLMCITCPYPKVAFDGYRAVCQYMVWFFLMIRLISDDGDCKTFYYALSVLGIALALHGIYQFIIAVPIPSGWVSQTESAVRTRVFSIVGSPNILGSLFVLLAPMVAALAYYLENIYLKLLAWCGVGVMCLSLLFTFSKGAWIGMAVAVIIFAFFIDRRLISLMLVGAAGAVCFVPSVANRITYLFTSDYVAASMSGGRMVRWETGRLLLQESNKWLGFGLGRFGGAVAMQNQILDKTDTFEYFYMDNYYLKTAVEMGYIGLIFFIILLAGLLIWLLRSVGRIHHDKMSLLGYGMFAGMCGVLVHCYFENIFEVPYMVSYFWAMGAAVFYLGYFRKRSTGLQS